MTIMHSLSTQKWNIVPHFNYIRIQLFTVCTCTKALQLFRAFIYYCY